MSLWKKNTLETDVCCEAGIGPLTVWVKKLGDEVRIASRVEKESISNARDDSQFSILQEVPKGLNWTRYISHREEVELSFLPVMPDRAVVMRPEEPLKLPPGRKAVFYVRIPIWVQVSAHSDGKDTVFCQIPTVELSNIWFGDPVAGQLCYSLRSRARREFIDFTPMPHRVICPVFISNKTEKMIDLERLCVQSQFLDIYTADSLMWTNDIKVEFQPKEDLAVFSYSNKPSTIKPKAQLLSKAKMTAQKKFLKRGFDSFKHFGGF